MYHKLICVGRMVNKPELRHTPSGKAVTDFTLAVDTGWGDSKETLWMKVTVWEGQAETVCKYMDKGRQILVEGELQHDSGNPRTWKGAQGDMRASFEMTARQIVFLGSKPEVEEDEIPF